MRFIRMTNKWYVRADLIRDIWIEGDTRIKISYTQGSLDKDSYQCDDAEEAKRELNRIVSTLNSLDHNIDIDYGEKL